MHTHTTTTTATATQPARAPLDLSALAAEDNWSTEQQVALLAEVARLSEALKESDAKLASVARAFYVDGKPSALRAALSDWKDVSARARALLPAE